ncbi:MAG: hypothetical protein RL336_1182 [Pseudomonadota bacterium]
MLRPEGVQFLSFETSLIGVFRKNDPLRNTGGCNEEVTIYGELDFRVLKRAFTAT